VTSGSRAARTGAIVAGVLTVAYCAAPELRGPAHLEIQLHHLAHAAMLLGGVVTGLLAAAAGTPRSGERPWWLIVAVLAPAIAMLLMWPSTYGYLETHAVAHFFDHILFATLGAATAFCGERYWRSIGWAAGVALVLTGLLSAGGFGFIR
jgi:hypothetical protein